jgi:hypothetical protein
MWDATTDWTRPWGGCCWTGGWIGPGPWCFPPGSASIWCRKRPGPGFPSSFRFRGPRPWRSAGRNPGHGAGLPGAGRSWICILRGGPARLRFGARFGLETNRSLRRESAGADPMRPFEVPTPGRRREIRRERDWRGNDSVETMLPLFEGPEKKLEVILFRGRKGLRSNEDGRWGRVVFRQPGRNPQPGLHGAMTPICCRNRACSSGTTGC